MTKTQEFEEWEHRASKIILKASLAVLVLIGIVYCLWNIGL